MSRSVDAALFAEFCNDPLVWKFIWGDPGYLYIEDEDPSLRDDDGQWKTTGLVDLDKTGHVRSSGGSSVGPTRGLFEKWLVSKGKATTEGIVVERLLEDPKKAHKLAELAQALRLCVEGGDHVSAVQHVVQINALLRL